MAKIYGLSSKSIDFVLAFPQADLEVPVFIELPLGFDAPDSQTRKHYVLRINKSLYGLKQAEYNRFAKLSNGLEDRGFVPSSIDPCVFFGQGCIVLTYVDDCIIVGDWMHQIDALIQSVHGGDEHFVLQEEGSIDKYLGVPRKYDWEYCGVIGMLTYLTGSFRPDIAMATHQCARFSIRPMRSHEVAVMRIRQYLLSTKDKRMIYRPDPKRGLEVFVDADFAGGWDPEDAENADNVSSRTGYVICYAGCPMFWQSKLQTNCIVNGRGRVHRFIAGSEGDLTYEQLDA